VKKRDQEKQLTAKNKEIAMLRRELALKRPASRLGNYWSENSSTCGTR
jgi:hypothetical protein